MVPAFVTQAKQKWKAGGPLILFWKLAIHAFKYIWDLCIHSWLKIHLLLTIHLYFVKSLWHQGFLTFLPFCFCGIKLTSFIQTSASFHPICQVLPSWTATAWHHPMGCVQLCPPLWLTWASCARDPFPSKHPATSRGLGRERKVLPPLQSVRSSPGHDWVLSSEHLFSEGAFLVPKLHWREGQKTTQHRKQVLWDLWEQNFLCRLGLAGAMQYLASGL